MLAARVAPRHTGQSTRRIGHYFVIRIAFYLVDHMLATSVALPLEQLRAAEQMHRGSRRGAAKPLELILFSEDGAPVRTHTGLALTPDSDIAQLGAVDIVFLPALWRNPQPVVSQHLATVEWLRQIAAKGTTLVGVGTGCCFMAEAGILNHQAATTHWFYFDQFARRYPLVDLKRQHFITRANNLYCAASVNALAELSIYFIGKLFDNSTAQRVERHFFHEVKAPTLHDPLADAMESHPDEAIAEAQSWLRANAAQPISIASLAARLKMSLRSFNRRFRAATQLSPLQYLQRARMQLASELLRGTNLSIQEVAYRAGYQDSTHFGQLFKAHFGITPSQYRTTVRAKLFNAR